MNINREYESVTDQSAVDISCGASGGNQGHDAHMTL